MFSWLLTVRDLYTAQVNEVYTKLIFSTRLEKLSPFLRRSSIHDAHKKWPIFWPPYPPHHPQKWTIDLLFKNNTIRRYATNFKAPSPLFRVDVINVCSLEHNFIVISASHPHLSSFTPALNNITHQTLVATLHNYFNSRNFGESFEIPIWRIYAKLILRAL